MGHNMSQIKADIENERRRIKESAEKRELF